jgi:hypothetical protein
VLDLNAPTRTVLGVDLAADTADPRLRYAYPGVPRVALREGRPDLELLRFVRDGTLTGGHLRLRVDLAHPEGRLAEVAAVLQSETPGAEPFRVEPVPVRSATTSLLFLGTEPNDQGGVSALLARPYGEVAAQVEPPHTAALALDLTPEGTSLMEAALRSGTAPIAVVSRLLVEGLWPAQRVVARVDWGRVYDHLSRHLKQGALLGVIDLGQVVEELREDRSVVVQAVQGLTPEQGGSPADVDAATAWVQREIVERFCEPVLPLSRTPARTSLGTVGEVLAVGSAFAAKRLTQVERGVATVDFQRAAVLPRTCTVQRHLADLLAGADGQPVDPAGFIIDADLSHPFFSRFSIRVRTAAPLADLGLVEVTGDLGYGTSGLPLRLTPEAPEATAETWADASPDRSWTLQATARFAAEAPVAAGEHVVLPAVKGSGRELTLDLEALLGLVRVDVAGTPDPRVLFSRVVLRHWRDAEQRAERELVLTPEAPSGSTWFADSQPGDRVDGVVEHLLVEGRSLASEPFAVDSRAVVLPPAFPDALSVSLVATEDWALDGVQRIAVALQRGPDQPTLTVLLDRPGAGATANLDLPDPADRRYRYRSSRTFADGTVQDDPWVTTDRPVLLVGGSAGSQLVVDLVPVGPELPIAGLLLIEVEVRYLDVANRVRAEQTFVLRALADRPRWQVPILDPSRRTYEYRITVHPAAGPVAVGRWTTATDRLLVVPVTQP